MDGELQPQQLVRMHWQELSTGEQRERDSKVQVRPISNSGSKRWRKAVTAVLLQKWQAGAAGAEKQGEPTLSDGTWSRRGVLRPIDQWGRKHKGSASAGVTMPLATLL